MLNPVRVKRIASQVGIIFMMLVLVLTSVHIVLQSRYYDAGVSGALPPSNADHGCVQSTSGNNLAPPALLQFAKTRKLSVERSDPRKCVFSLPCSTP